MTDLYIFASGVVFGALVIIAGIRFGVKLFFEIKEDMPSMQTPIEQNYTFEETE